MRDVGLYRIAPHGQIRKSYYNYETKTLGPYTFDAPIPYIEKYHMYKAEPSLYYLYEALLGNPEALCVFFANNDYVAVVTERSIIYTNIYKTNDILPYKFSKPLHHVECIPVGYVKTYAECVSIATLPYRLFYSDILHSIYLEDKWIAVKDEPVLNTELKLYAELLKHDEAEAVYMNSEGKMIFVN